MSMMMASAPDFSAQADSSRSIARERIVERIHEDAAHGVDHQHMPAILGIDHRRAAARRAGGIVDRADQPRRAFDEHQGLALVPGVIAERDRIGAGVEQLLIDRLGDAEAAGGVLAVDHDEIELPVGDQARQAFGDDMASAAPDDIADEKNTHAYALRQSMISRSVSTRSSRASRSVAGTCGDFLRRKGNADGGDGFHPAQPVDGHVVIARAIADAVTAAVEGEQRHDQDIGIDFRRLGLRLAEYPTRPSSSASPKAHGAHGQRLAAAGDHRQRQLARPPLPSRISGIGLISLRIGMKPETMAPGGIAMGKPRAAMASPAPCRSSCGSVSRCAIASLRSCSFDVVVSVESIAGIPRVRISCDSAGNATRQRRLWRRLRRQRVVGLAAFEIVSRVDRRIGEDTGAGAKQKSLGVSHRCGAAKAVRAVIPGTYISRWAPYTRAQGPGQGQLPSRS